VCPLPPSSPLKALKAPARRRSSGASPRTSREKIPAHRHPGARGTPLADQIRGLVLTPREETVFPRPSCSLRGGGPSTFAGSSSRPSCPAAAVLCDRFSDATTAVPGAGEGARPGTGGAAEPVRRGGLVPDLTLLFDLPPRTGSPGSRDAASRRTGWSASPSPFTVRCAMGTCASPNGTRTDRSGSTPPSRKKRCPETSFGRGRTGSDGRTPLRGHRAGSCPRPPAAIPPPRGGSPGLLFSGEEGVGKEKTARAFAAALSPEVGSGRVVRDVSRLAGCWRPAPIPLLFSSRRKSSSSGSTRSARCRRNSPSRRSPTARARAPVPRGPDDAAGRQRLAETLRSRLPART